VKDAARPSSSGRAVPPSIMPLRLRDNLHWCECGGRIVFLDVTADRYFGLPAKAHDTFLSLAQGDAEPKDADQLKMLMNCGILVESQSLQPFQRPAAIETPTSDSLDDLNARSGFVPIIHALRWEYHAAWKLRTRGFSEVIAQARRQGCKARRTDIAAERKARSIAAAADAIAFFTRAHNRCLVRALGVQAACRAHGINASLVLGVIAHPFAAHSWVQNGSEVLVGGYEHARLYTPILVLE
jgi:hypothetical protein